MSTADLADDAAWAEAAAALAELEQAEAPDDDHDLDGERHDDLDGDDHDDLDLGERGDLHLEDGADEEEQLADADAAYAFARDVVREAHQLRVRDAARRKVAAERSGTVERPAPTQLANFLAVPDVDAAYRVDRLWPTGGRIVLAAQWKAGKTTIGGNLLRALVDGEPFLDAFPVTPASSVVLVDDELDERTLRRWLRDQNIRNTAAVRVVPLRGRVSTFDLLDDQTRAEWATELAGADVVILDCLRPVLDALGLDESREAGRFLVAFDALLRAVGGHDAADGLVVHHMGHSAERSRGDSRILDWPDATWKLVREDPDDPASPRYLSGFGRDVDVPEGRLEYDAATRRLALAGGTRRDTAADAAWPDIQAALLEEHPGGLTGRQVEASLRDSEHGRDQLRLALRRAVERGDVATRPGKQRAVIHTISDLVRESARECAPRTSGECASALIGSARALTSHSEQASARAAHSESELPQVGRSAEAEQLLIAADPVRPCGCGQLMPKHHTRCERCAGAIITKARASA